MVVGAVRSRIEPDVPQWDAVVGERFIAAVAAPARDRVLTALAEAASIDGLELEDLVARIPIGSHGADDFALVWWPEAGDPVTAIVRGEAVIDLASPGGARRFDSRGISPWHLAEFTAVTRLRIAGPGAPLDAVRQAGLRGEPVPSRRASFRAGAIEWSWREMPSGSESGDPDADTVLEARRPPTGGARPGARDPRPQADGPTTVPIQVVVGDTVRFVRGDAADADTVLSPRLRRDGGPRDRADDPGRSDAATADSDGGAPAAPGRAEQAAPSPARFRIGAGEPMAIDAPAYIGRNPAPPRVAPGPISLVRVESPAGVVSSTHLELRVEGSRVVATDLRSTNGTVVRSAAGVRRLRPGESVVVSPGTTIELGGEAVVEILAREVVDAIATSGRGALP
ncbi:FHA domain-containing protein [Agromyces sp. NPDC056523]|uniref:FHA domain-containing protein n=1 Tax=Agromyces sp. NPDC056523 TaxID=3345850 RepID=UPI003670ACA9